MPLYIKGDKFLVVEKNSLNVEECDKANLFSGKRHMITLAIIY